MVVRTHVLRHLRLSLLLRALLAAGAPAVLGANDGTTNPCKVVTAVNARAAWGHCSGGNADKCRPVSELHVQNGAGKTLIVLVRKLSQPDFVKSAKANAGKVVAVRGIGSAAFSVQSSALLFWRNGTEVTLDIVGVAGPLQTEERLAKTVAGRL